jgi:hypothetical protein
MGTPAEAILNDFVIIFFGDIHEIIKYAGNLFF